MTGPFKAMLFMLAGFCLNAGLTSVLIGLRSRRDPVFLVFGVMAALLAISGALSTLSYQVSGEALYLVVVRFEIFFTCLATLGLLWFVAIFSGYSPRRFLLAVSAAITMGAIACLIHPRALYYARLDALDVKIAPWGERFAYGLGTVNPWFVPLYGVLLAVLMYTLVAARKMISTGNRKMGVSLMLGAALYGVTMGLDVLVSLGQMWAPITLGTLGMLVFVLLMSYHIADRFFQKGVELEAVNAAMRREVAARRSAQDRKERLIEELNHRVRNNLASVLSIVNLTRAGADSVPRFADVLRSRIKAMSEAHDLLAHGNYEAVKLRELLETILGQFVAWDDETMRVSGPDVTVRPGQTIPLAMTLHELAVNALVHGSLGKRGGILEVRWEVHEAEEEVVLVWREIGPVTPVEKRDGGRGLKLVRGFIEHELGGDVDWRLEPTGVRCELSWPMTMRKVARVDEDGQSMEESATFAFRLFNRP